MKLKRVYLFFNKCLSITINLKILDATVVAVPDEIKLLHEKMKSIESEKDNLKGKIMEITQEATKIQNNQQNQLQGAMAVRKISGLV